MKYVYDRRNGRTYRAKRRPPTPEEEECLRRWLERRDAELRRRFPAYFKD